MADSTGDDLDNVNRPRSTTSTSVRDLLALHKNQISRNHSNTVVNVISPTEDEENKEPTKFEKSKIRPRQGHKRASARKKRKSEERRMSNASKTKERNIHYNKTQQEKHSAKRESSHRGSHNSNRRGGNGIAVEGLAFMHDEPNEKKKRNNPKGQLHTLW